MVMMAAGHREFVFSARSEPTWYGVKQRHAILPHKIDRGANRCAVSPHDALPAVTVFIESKKRIIAGWKLQGHVVSRVWHGKDCVLRGSCAVGQDRFWRTMLAALCSVGCHGTAGETPAAVHEISIVRNDPPANLVTIVRVHRESDVDRRRIFTAPIISVCEHFEVDRCFISASEDFRDTRERLVVNVSCRFEVFDAGTVIHASIDFGDARSIIHIHGCIVI